SILCFSLMIENETFRHPSKAKHGPEKKWFRFIFTILSQMSFHYMTFPFADNKCYLGEGKQSEIKHGTTFVAITYAIFHGLSNNMEVTRKELKKTSGSTVHRNESSKIQLLKNVERGDCDKKANERFQNDIILENNNHMKISFDKTISFENLDFSDTDTELRNNTKLFHTSTTELYEKKSLKRSSSLFSTSRSSLASGSFAGASSNVTLSSTGSSACGGLPEKGQHETRNQYWTEQKPEASESRRRLSSNSKFNEYVCSTSSWEWEDEESLEVPELQDAFAYRKRRPSYRNSISSETSDLIDFDGIQKNGTTQKIFPEVNPRPLPVLEQPSTSFAASGILRASCPTLNANDVTGGALKHILNPRNKSVKNTSASTFEIAKASPTPPMTSSKSSSCISSVRSVTFLNNKRPITLRFTPSGLTETSRVVWMTETGDHTGTVKWVGKIRDKFYAGIEFEKAVGNSSGIYGYGHGLQIRLFTCKLGYGRFIPVDELILYEDYYENQKTGFICIICRDDFIEPGECDEGLDVPEKFMVATKCGHLFHQLCLNHWFNEKSAAFQNCPYCHFPMERNDTIRIFPAQLK
ncbi:unnamed protein product, partial [Allacma fusca]